MAEVLITLGIIGMVAAMTLPALVNKYQKIQTATQLKKVFSTLKQATEFAKNDYGDVQNWDYSLSEYDFMQKYYKPYLKVIVDKKAEKHSWTDLRGNLKTDIKPTLILTDGTYIFLNFSVGFASRYMIIVDINGKQKPNKVGRDVFAFTLYNNLLQTYHQGDTASDYYYRRRRFVLGDGGTSGQCNKKADGGIIGAGSYCSRLIEMDGWEIKDDYPW